MRYHFDDEYFVDENGGFIDKDGYTIEPDYWEPDITIVKSPGIGSGKISRRVVLASSEYRSLLYERDHYLEVIEDQLPE